MSARERKMLFMPSDEMLEGFYALAKDCSKLCLVVWALQYSEKYVGLFEEYCDDDRVRRSREAAYYGQKAR